MLAVRAALSLAPMSIISTCAGLSVAWNVLLAPCTLGEQLTKVRVGAAAAIVAGTICMGVFGPRPGMTGSLAPGKSRFTSMAPSMVFKDGKPMLKVYITETRHGEVKVSTTDAVDEGGD